MALYGEGTNMTGAVFDGTTLNAIQCDGTWVWARPFTLSSSAGTGTTVTITRSSSPYAGAATGTISAGTTIYYGDVITAKYSLTSGYAISTATINVNGTSSNLTTSAQSFTVTGNISISTTAVLQKFTFKSVGNMSVHNDSPFNKFVVTRTSCPSGLGECKALINPNYSYWDGQSSCTVYKGDVLNIKITVRTEYYRLVDIDINGVSYSSLDFNITINGDTTCTLVTLYTSWGSGWSMGSNTGNLTFSGDTLTGATGTVGDLSIAGTSKGYAVRLYDGSKYFRALPTSTSGSSYDEHVRLAKYIVIDSVGPITKIGAGAFKNNRTVGTVSIGNTITTIGDEAFRGSSCKFPLNGSSTHDPSGITSIGAYAFADSDLTEKDVHQLISTNITYGKAALCTKNGWAYFYTTNQTLVNKLIAMRGSSSSDSTCYAIRSCGFEGVQFGKSGGDNAAGGTIYLYWRWTNSKITKTATGSALEGYYEYNPNGLSAYTFSVGQHKITPVYCVICDNNGTFTGSMHIGSSSLSNYSSASYSITTTWNACGTSTSTSVSNNGSAYVWHIDFSYTTTCLTDHTLLTLANGSRKRADQITYRDLLLCYNFETGKQDCQYPLVITRGEIHDHFTRVHLENNLYIDICGHHDIYDPEAHLFRTYGDGHILSTGLKDYYILDDSGQTVKIRSIERVEKEVTAYCIVTSGTTTAYADTAMVGMQHMNYSRIGEDNKFTKAFETDKLLCYDYNTFKQEIYDEPEQDLILGLNLHYAHYYNKDASGLPRLLAPLKRRIPLPQYKNKNLYTLGFIDKELTEMQSVEDELIVLPEIKSPGKTKWYIVGEYKYLNPGDTYITKFSTVIRAV